MNNFGPGGEAIVAVGGGEERLKSLFEEEGGPLKGLSGGGLKALIEALQYDVGELEVIGVETISGADYVFKEFAGEVVGIGSRQIEGIEGGGVVGIGGFREEEIRGNQMGLMIEGVGVEEIRELRNMIIGIGIGIGIGVWVFGSRVGVIV